MALAAATEALYGWETCDGGLTYNRPLTNLERMFVILNNLFYGQNCPYIGAQVSIQGLLDTSRLCLSDIDLEERAKLAFQGTRWTYPTVACRIIDDNQMTYSCGSADDVEAWAERTVHLVKDHDNWVSLREKLTQEASLPSEDGDCCFVYIVPTRKGASQNVVAFDVLIHIHHALVDGSGLRSILDSFLALMAGGSTIESIYWGQENDRLLPAAIDISTEVEMVSLKSRPDIGLPLYRPDILTAMKENQGSSFLTHTFDSDSFLPDLLDRCRKHYVKLTALLQAALFKAVYDFAESPPTYTEKYTSLAAIDLRNNGRMKQPFGDRNRYPFNAIVSEVIDIPCRLFSSNMDTSQFWKVAAHINTQYTAVSKSKGLALISDEIIGRVLEEIGKLRCVV
ncbi:hypothetical protein N7533_010630 [Penicillium manginii]|uniref:uncharacterized protein n=1 Tax=Penicillium manginii TaxID=203109 RepID=UPI002547E36A|nr:uncharacterized protein N7533_010630 [Penicillium manginii]KAJ5743528.1 hypothetical protein N7533_010630 [Penicillium manginii]